MKSSVKPLKSLDVISQIKTAAKNPVALLFGIMLGGFVPLATYHVSHSTNGWDPILLLAVGGLLYSAKTVWQWGRLAFDCPYKATGFVALIEGVMVFSTIAWLATTALCYLIVINAIATGCQLALRQRSLAPQIKSKSTTARTKAKTTRSAPQTLRRVI